MSQSCWVFAVFKQIREGEKSTLRLTEKVPSHRVLNKASQVQKLSSRQPGLMQLWVEKEPAGRRQ